MACQESIIGRAELERLISNQITLLHMLDVLRLTRGKDAIIPSLAPIGPDACTAKNQALPKPTNSGTGRSTVNIPADPPAYDDGLPGACTKRTGRANAP